MKKKSFSAIILRSQSTMIFANIFTQSQASVFSGISITTSPNLYIFGVWTLRARIFALWAALWFDPSTIMVAYQCDNCKRKRGATQNKNREWSKRKKPFHQSINAQLLVHHPLPSCIILESLRSSWAVAELQWPPVWLLSPTKPPM